MKCIALTTLLDKGKIIDIGSEVELTEEQVAMLGDNVEVVLAEGKPKKGKGKKKETEQEEDTESTEDIE